MIAAGVADRDDRLALTALLMLRDVPIRPGSAGRFGTHVAHIQCYLNSSGGWSAGSTIRIS